MIQLYVIEDHPVIVEGLYRMFHLSSQGFKVIGSSKNVDGLISEKETMSANIILLDLYLPESRPDINVLRLKKFFPNIPIVIYTAEESINWKRKMMRLGVHAYITKDATKTEIMVVLQKVAKGEYLMSSNDPFKESFFQVINQSTFTKNQLELLKILCEVKNQKTVAKIKGTTVSNIERTLRIMRRNVKAGSNLELIKMCTERGII